MPKKPKSILEQADILTFLIAFIFADYLHSAFDLVWFGDRNYSLWQFLLFPLISAIISTMGAIVLKRKIVDRYLPRLKANIKVNTFKLLGIFTLLILVFFMIAGLYKVETTDAFVLTELSGKKVIMDDVGWHYRLQGLTSLEKYNLRNNILDFPNPETAFNDVKVVTKDNKVVEFNSILYYKINDLNKWGIQTNNAHEQLRLTMGLTITEIIKTSDFNDLISSKSTLSYDVINKMSNITRNLGISIYDLKIRIIESQEVISAKSEAEKLKIISEAKIKEAENLKQATDLQRIALKDLDPKILEYLSNLELYKTLQISSVLLNILVCFLVGNNLYL